MGCVGEESGGYENESTRVQYVHIGGEGSEMWVGWMGACITWKVVFYAVL